MKIFNKYQIRKILKFCYTEKTNLQIRKYKKRKKTKQKITILKIIWKRKKLFKTNKSGKIF